MLWVISGPDFFVIAAVFGDEDGIVLEVEGEAEAAGHDCCAM